MKADAPTINLNRQLEAYAAVAKSPGQNARRRWGKWPIYAAATGAALAGASAASADIIYSGVQDLTATAVENPGIDTAGLPIDVDGQNDIFDFVVRDIIIPRITFAGSLNVKFSGVGRSGGIFTSGGLAKTFRSGALIAGTRGLHPQALIYSAFHRSHSCFGVIGEHCTMSTGHRGKVVPGLRTGGFLGIEFNGKTGPREYGWIRVAVGKTSFGGILPPDGIEVIDWAYNTDGPILAGQTSGPSPVPEPGAMPVMLLAAGAAGVLAWKRRRQSAKA
jgi:PEP-CTERM motif